MISVVPTIYFFFPETSGRSLEELDEIFASSKSIFDVVPNAQRLPKRNLAEYLDEEKNWHGTQHVEHADALEGNGDLKIED